MSLISSVNLEFNMDMDASTMNVQSADGVCTGSIQFSTDDTFTNCISGTLSGSGKNWTFTPFISLEEESSYFLRVSTDARTDSSTNGVTLTADYKKPFSTEDLPVLNDLVTWYKTNQDLYKGLANGDDVTFWKNSKSANNNTDVASWKIPEYLKDFTNGRSAVRFNASNRDRFNTFNPNFVPPLSGSSGYTVFIVFKADDVSRDQTILDIVINGVFRPRFRITNDFGSLQLKSIKADSDPLDVVSTGTLKTNNYNIAAAYTDYELNETGIFLEDGSSFSFSEKSAPAWDTTGGTTCSNTPARNFLIGQSTNWWRSDNFDGSISDVIIYNRRLSKEERESVVCFLGRKFNIPVNNPAGCL